MGLMEELRPPVDALLLAEFVALRRRDRVVEFGCGRGAILLRLAERYPDARGLGLELDPAATALARRAASRHGIRRLDFVVADYRRPPLPARLADAVVANPPYRVPGTGRLSPTRARERHEICGSLADLLDGARLVLRPKGRLFLVHLAERAADVLCSLRERNLEPKRLRWCHHETNSDASLLLVEARDGARPGLKVEPPLLVHRFQAELPGSAMNGSAPHSR